MPAPPAEAQPADLYACPRCDRTPLESTPTSLHCAGCKIEFPRVAGLPWLFAEPTARYGEWRGRLHFLLRTLEQRIAELGEACKRSATDGPTCARLSLLLEATTAHKGHLQSLLAPLDVDALIAERTTYLALRTRLPPDQGLATYYGNVHRDWAWGDAENAASLEVLFDRLGDRRAGRTLVLGCGAGRLAHDFQVAAAPERMLAVDFNPLLVFVADRMSRGEALELYEFPVAPLDLQHSAVLRRLAAPSAAAVEYCLADVHRPPFAARSFDTIITPWLVDILPEPFDQQARRINRLLADGGIWINFGSLSFHSPSPAEQFSPEECVAALGDCGFECGGWTDTTLPYLSSPASRHARTETVASWGAVKSRHIGKADRYEALPDWIVRGKDPVPLLDHFRTQAVSTRVHAYLLSLIDGRRSIADIAVAFEQQRLMTRAEAEAAIRTFMITLYDDSRRGVRY